MLVNNKVRFVLSIAGAVAITFALNRCSPIAPSLSKNGFNSGNLPSESGGISGGRQALGKSSATAPAVVKGPYSSVQPEDNDTHSLLVANLESTPLEQTKLEELKNSGHTDITIPDELTTRDVHVTFRLNLSADEIASQHLDGFETRLDHKSGEIWSLSVKHPDAISSTVLDHLTSVSISIQPEAATAVSAAAQN